MLGEVGAPESSFWDGKLHDSQAYTLCEYQIYME